jgi:hypothetical protein
MPYGFLTKTMHFAASVVEETGVLPQVSWLEIDSRLALTIHEKRVELDQLWELCMSLLKLARIQLDFPIKMVIKTMDWSNFDPEDDLTETKDGYSFMRALNNVSVQDKLR